MKLLRSVNTVTEKVSEWIMFLFALIMVLSCFAQICTRLAGIPLSWSEELARYMAVWLTFIGAAYALRKGTLATVEIMYNSLKGVNKKILFVVISVLIIAFSIILIKFGFDFSLKFMGQKSPAMQIPKGLVYLSAPVTGVLMLMYQMEILFDNIFKKEAE